METEILHSVDPMTSLFLGLKFLFIPNSKAGVSKIRQKLAVDHGAQICSAFGETSTTHVLVDTKVVPTANTEALIRTLKKLGLRDIAKTNVPVVGQEWLVQCVSKSELLPTANYTIDLARPSPKKRKVSSLRKAESRPIVDTTLEPGEKVLDSPNQTSIDILNEMAEQHRINGEAYKVKAYRNAIDTLQRVSTPVTSYSQAIQLEGVGPAIAKKIEEISRTHHLRQLDVSKGSRHTQLMKLFKGIYGVGTVIAKKWIDEGMTSLDDIKNRTDLTDAQRLGLQYYDEWNERIPRSECTIHAEYVQYMLNSVDPLIEATIGGSYRRGVKTCGDIDFIVTKPDATMEALQADMDNLIDTIKQAGYLQCILHHHVKNKLLTGCSLPPLWNKKVDGQGEEWGKCRRVDFLLVPWKELGAAMIYFTGDDEFNKKLRYRAQKHGMVLNGTGLYKIVRDGSKERHQLVESFDEKKIMSLLNVKWHEPEQRNTGVFDIAWNG